MDFQALLHNKWALGGLGVAAAAGAFVLYRRKTSGGTSSGGSTGAQTSPGYSGSVGTFDSTGTDVANWLGSYSGNLQNQLNDYQAQLKDSLAGLALVPPAATGTGPGPGPTAAPPPLGPEWINIFGGQPVDAWIKSLNSAGVAVDYGSLVNLNAGPLSKFGGLPGIINWKQGSGPNADHSKNTFKFDTALKVR